MYWNRILKSSYRIERISALNNILSNIQDQKAQSHLMMIRALDLFLANKNFVLQWVTKYSWMSNSDFWHAKKLHVGKILRQPSYSKPNGNSLVELVEAWLSLLHCIAQIMSSRKLLPGAYSFWTTHCPFAVDSQNALELWHLSSFSGHLSARKQVNNRESSNWVRTLRIKLPKTPILHLVSHKSCFKLKLWSKSAVVAPSGKSWKITSMASFRSK